MSVKSKFKRSRLWNKIRPFVMEQLIKRNEYKKFYSEAKKQFYFHPELQKGNLNDYRRALKKHRVTYGEYMHKFEYWRLNESERDKFISCSEMQCIYRKMVFPEVKMVFWNKVLFLNKFNEFAKRKWIEVRKSSYEDFCNMVYQFDCIAKPIEGWRGIGITKIEKVSEGTDLHSLFAECVKNNILLEEKIRACKEIEEFHPSSLNTVRVVTISNPNKCVIFGAILRMGTGGSLIDNTHNGGVFASIDVKTGVIETDGLDSDGNKYIVHPDSMKPIKGFQIPYWDKVVETCTKATKVMPKTMYAGWDVVIKDNGEVGLIEGNHGPDFDGGMQAPKKIGVKQRVKDTVMELYGIDPLQYISVTSTAYNGYRYNEKVI